MTIDSIIRFEKAAATRFKNLCAYSLALATIGSDPRSQISCESSQFARWSLAEAKERLRLREKPCG